MSSAAQTALPEMLRIAPVKRARKDVDFWPLLKGAATPQEMRVNEKLKRLNRRLSTQLIACDANYKNWHVMVGEGGRANGQSGEWSRTVEVTMWGPQYLSLVATEDVFCGGAHPDTDEVALVFDMSTGKTVNWVAMVGKRAGASSFAGTVIDGSTVSALILPTLAKLYDKGADPDCKRAESDGSTRSFQLWPDAKSGSLVATEFDLPHVARACAAQINLSLPEARQLGFSNKILRAIEGAHRGYKTQH